MEVFICIKRFNDRSNYRDEVLGVFSTFDKASCFASEFPKISMDDPNTFDVMIEKFLVDKTVWD